MFEFKTQFDERPRFYTRPGSKEHTLYGSSYDDRGRLQLEETGKENLYDYIQSFKDSVDIHVIMKKFQEGDHSVLERAQTAYGDFTDFPTTYAELLNTVNDGENFFNSLPVDVRALFGHSFGEFMAGMQDGSTFEKLGYKTAEPEAPSVEQPEAVEQLKEVIANEPQR